MNRRVPDVAICTALVCAGVLTAGAAAACGLSGFSGQWEGNGFAQRDLTSPREVVRCRFGLAPAGASKQSRSTWRLRLDCRGPDLRFGLRGDLKGKGQENRWIGTVKGQRRGSLGLVKKGSSKAVGRCQGADLIIDLTFLNLETGNREKSRLKATKAPSKRLTLEATAPSPAEQDVSDKIVFRVRLAPRKAPR